MNLFISNMASWIPSFIYWVLICYHYLSNLLARCSQVGSASLDPCCSGSDILHWAVLTSSSSYLGPDGLEPACFFCCSPHPRWLWVKPLPPPLLLCVNICLTPLWLRQPTLSGGIILLVRSAQLSTILPCSHYRIPDP